MTHLILLIGFVVCLFGCKGDAESNALYKYRIEYVFHATGLRQAQVRCLLPSSLAGRQEIIQQSTSLVPVRIDTVAGERWGTFRFIQPGDSFRLILEGQLRLGRPGFLPAHRYVLDVRDSLEVASLQGWGLPVLATPSPSGTFAAIAKMVSDSLRYRVQKRDLDWSELLARRQGDCTEYARLAARLCQRFGYEARIVSGVQGMDSIAAGEHSWAECRTSALDWVRVDPLFAVSGVGAYLELEEWKRNRTRWIEIQFQGDSLTVQTNAKLMPI